jgi:tripartite-type tricarboxylate transporter receptor subunit TctC
MPLPGGEPLNQEEEAEGPATLMATERASRGRYGEGLRQVQSGHALTARFGFAIVMKKIFSMLVVLLAGTLMAAPAMADYPDRALRMVVPFGAGGGVDALARPLAKELGQILGQSVIVENKPSTNGQIGMTEVARAQPDGYTMVMSSAAYALAPAFYRDLPYDIQKDFAPVTILASNPLVLVASTHFKASTVKQMIDMARARSGSVNFAAPGNSGIHFLAGELMGTVAGVKWTSVPYKGAGPAFPDLISGQVDVMFDNPASSLPFVQSGRLKLLATTGQKRLAAAGDAPTVAETLPGFDAANWFVLAVPAGTPPDRIRKLHDASVQAMKQPDLVEFMKRNGIGPILNTPAEAAAYIRSEAEKWGGVVRDNRLAVQ